MKLAPLAYDALVPRITKLRCPFLILHYYSCVSFPHFFFFEFILHPQLTALPCCCCYVS